MKTEKQIEILRMPILGVIQLILLISVATLHADPFSPGPVSWSNGTDDPFAPAHLPQSTKDYGNRELKAYSVPSDLKSMGYKRDDMFVILKKNSLFSSLASKYNIDDPGTWASLESQIKLKNEQLILKIQEAEAMAKTTDMSSRMDGRTISKADVRQRGKELLKSLRSEYEDNLSLLRIINELKAALILTHKTDPLTGLIKIVNTAGQGFEGAIVMADGNDAIIHRKSDDLYFRVPFNSLSESTRNDVFNCLISSLDVLPGMNLSLTVNEFNAGDLYAYDDTYLYLMDRFEGFIRVLRTTDTFIFSPYENRLEQAIEISSASGASIGDTIRFTVDQALDASRWKGLGLYGSNLYQISIGGSTTAILCTNQTDFVTTGWAEMRVKWVDYIQVVTWGGTHKTVRVYREASEKEVKEHLADISRVESIDRNMSINAKNLGSIKEIESRLNLRIAESSREPAQEYQDQIHDKYNASHSTKGEMVN